MNILLLVACVGMIIGFFTITSLSPTEFTNDIFKGFLNRKKSIRDEINEETKRKKASFISRELKEIESILRATGRGEKFPVICTMSLFFFAIGASIAIMISNIFMIPVLALGFFFIPFWYVRLTQTHFKKDIATELETALSIITTAYMRNEDVLTAVEENIDYLNPPVLSVFKKFLYGVRMINPDIVAGLKELKEQIDNDVFREWCDGMISCQYDRSLKSTLSPIVAKLSDMRVVNGELDNMVFEPRKEFITMQLLVL